MPAPILGSSPQPPVSSNPSPPTAPPLVLEELKFQSPSASLAMAQELLLEYGRFVASQGNVASFCYGEQGGGAILALVDSQAVGFVAWRSLADPALAHAWELKRLWIRANARGIGAGKALVQAVIDRARAAHKRTLLLDTEPRSMASAHRLYLRMGFGECSPYNGQAADGIIYMRKNL
jgi:GNAT superfamily N-acetyltransferase